MTIRIITTRPEEFKKHIDGAFRAIEYISTEKANIDRLKNLAETVVTIKDSAPERIAANEPVEYLLTNKLFIIFPYGVSEQQMEGIKRTLQKIEREIQAFYRKYNFS